MAEYIEKEGIKKSISFFFDIRWKITQSPIEVKQAVLEVIDGERVADVQPVNCINPFELIKAVCTSTTWCIDCKYGSICPMKDKNCVKPCNW